MKTRLLGTTDLHLPILSFGASSLGQEFRSITLEEAIRSVRTALDLGMNFIDTSPFYGRGASEVLLGFALQDVPRDQYMLGTKLGRYDLHHFDFSAKRVVESVDVSLHRMRTDYLDLCLCHDIEFVPLEWIIQETLPALYRLKEQGKVRYVGISGYPMKAMRYVVDHTALDAVLSYNQYTLQNTRFADELVPLLKQKGVGVMNAGPFSARLLTKATNPLWLKESPEVIAAAERAAAYCEGRGVDIAQLALQFSVANEDMTTTVAGSANPENIRKWSKWMQQTLDEELLHDVQAIFEPVKNLGHVEGLPVNN